MSGKYIFFGVVMLSLIGFLLIDLSAADQMPMFSLENAKNGEIMDSSILEDKAVLITFFSTTCPPCVEEVPSLKTLQAKYEMDGFSVVAISLDFGREKAVRKFIERHAVTYPVVFGTHEIALGFGGVRTIPQSFLINRQGHIVQRYEGYRPLEILERDLRLIL